MESRAHALIAGVFTLLLGVAALVTIWWLSDRATETREYVLVTQSSVTGLNAQAQVRYRGMRAGKVLDIALDPNNLRNILVLVEVDASMPVTRGTTAVLNFQGVTGLAYIELQDNGDNPDLLSSNDGLPRIPLTGSSLEGLIQEGAAMVEHVKTVADRVNRVLSDQNLKRLDTTLANIADASENLHGAMADLPQLTRSVKHALSEENLKHFEQLITNLEKASVEVSPMATEARKLIANIQTLSARLDNISDEAGGQLSRQTLPKLNRLLDDLSKNSRQLGRVLSDIESSPNVLLFGKDEMKPGPGEAGFVTPGVGKSQ